jgi:hypothetical protein
MRLATTAALVAGAVLALGTVAPAEAAPPPRIDLRSTTLGTYVLDDTGAAVVTGDVTGKPFDGAYTAVLIPADGSLPEPGVCEPGSATVDVTGAKGRYLQLAATGEICGKWVGPNNAVTHKLVGRYQVTDSSVRNTQGTDGWIGLGLATEGRAFLEAIDT